MGLRAGGSRLRSRVVPSESPGWLDARCKGSAEGELVTARPTERHKRHIRGPSAAERLSVAFLNRQDTYIPHRRRRLLLKLLAPDPCERLGEISLRSGRVFEIAIEARRISLRRCPQHGEIPPLSHSPPARVRCLAPSCIAQGSRSPRAPVSTSISHRPWSLYGQDPHQNARTDLREPSCRGTYADMAAGILIFVNYRLRRLLLLPRTGIGRRQRSMERCAARPFIARFDGSAGQWPPPREPVAQS
jgi:hypothetical protein